MQPLDVREWLQGLSLSSDTKAADFALEALEHVENEARLDLLEDMASDLEKAAPDQYKEKPDKALEWIIGQEPLLCEIGEALDDAKGIVDLKNFVGSPASAVSYLISLVEDLQTELDILKQDEMPPTYAQLMGLEYDL